MPQVDLVSACAGGVSDSKIVCETLAVDDPTPSDQPDFPPDSFFISKDAEFDWIDRNAFIERKDSGKGGSFHSTAHPSASQRYSLCVKSKPSIIGLPKSQKAAYTEVKHRRPPSIRLFPKRLLSLSNSGRKSGAPVTEPSSPKVSCIGRVRSKRDRSRRKKNRQKLPEPTIKRSRSIKIPKTGFWSNFRSIFGSRGPKQPKDDEPDSEPVAAGKLKKSKSLRKRNFAKAESSPISTSTPPSDPPSLVAVKQFTSGRRSGAWAADLEADGANQE